MANRWEIEGRADKAWKLTRWCQNHGVDSAMVAGWTDLQWSVAAKAAGVKLPSDRTRGLVIGFLTPKAVFRR